MKKIASFTIDHMRLLPGIYVSRKDDVNGNILTTFDLRLTRPNVDTVMENDEIHAIEHLAATYLRNDKQYASKTIYFGPMGCRTGFYLILAGDYQSEDIVQITKDMFTFIADYEGEIPGATAIDCGNYSDMNLNKAKLRSKKYLDNVLKNISSSNLNYPE